MLETTKSHLPVSLLCLSIFASAQSELVPLKNPLANPNQFLNNVEVHGELLLRDLDLTGWEIGMKSNFTLGKRFQLSAFIPLTNLTYGPSNVGDPSFFLDFKLHQSPGKYQSTVLSYNISIPVYREEISSYFLLAYPNSSALTHHNFKLRSEILLNSRLSIYPELTVHFSQGGMDRLGLYAYLSSYYPPYGDYEITNKGKSGASLAYQIIYSLESGGFIQWNTSFTNYVLRNSFFTNIEGSTMVKQSFLNSSVRWHSLKKQV